MKAGLALGFLVFLWTLFMGITGWYKDPVLLNMFYVVTGLVVSLVLAAFIRKKEAA